MGNIRAPAIFSSPTAAAINTVITSWISAFIPWKRSSWSLPERGQRFLNIGDIGQAGFPVSVLVFPGERTAHASEESWVIYRTPQRDDQIFLPRLSLSLIHPGGGVYSNHYFFPSFSCKYRLMCVCMCSWVPMPVCVSLCVYLLIYFEEPMF